MKNKYFIQEMRSKKETPCYVDTGACTIYWRDKKVFPILNVIHNTKFDINNQTVNHHFIIDYFKII